MHVKCVRFPRGPQTRLHTSSLAQNIPLILSRATTSIAATCMVASDELVARATRTCARLCLFFRDADFRPAGPRPPPTGYSGGVTASNRILTLAMRIQYDATTASRITAARTSLESLTPLMSAFPFRRSSFHGFHAESETAVLPQASARTPQGTTLRTAGLNTSKQEKAQTRLPCAERSTLFTST